MSNVETMVDFCLRMSRKYESLSHVAMEEAFVFESENRLGESVDAFHRSLEYRIKADYYKYRAQILNPFIKVI